MRGMLSGFIVYPSTEQTRLLFTNEAPAKKYEITLKGRTAQQTTLNSVLEIELRRIGADIKTHPKTNLSGKRKIFGIPVVIRMATEDRKKQILVKVYGKDYGSVRTTLKQISDIVKTELGIEHTGCVYPRPIKDKIKVNIDKNKPELKTPKFSESKSKYSIEVEKEIQGLKNAVADIRDDIKNNNKTKTHETVLKERKAKKEVLV